MEPNVRFEHRETAFTKRLTTFAIVNINHIDIKAFLNDAYTYFDDEMQSVFDSHEIVKISACLNVTFEKDIPEISTDDHGNQRTEIRKEKRDLNLYTDSIIVEKDTDLPELFKERVVVTILRKVDEAIMQGSGFRLSSINEFTVEVNSYDPLRGSSYIKLPKFLADKHAIINVQNNDDKCFMWAALSARHQPPKHPQRVSNYYPYRNKLNFTGIKFPVQLNSIEKFEKLNDLISINVFMFDSDAEKVRPLRITKNRKSNHINLMLISEQIRGNDIDDESSKQHYCWIKDLSRLVASQVSNHKSKHFFCDRCLNYFWCKESLEKHSVNCAQQNDCQIEMPTEKNSIIMFKNYKNQVECPFIIYADVEALLKKPTERFCKQGSTVALQKHEVYSIGYYMKCAYDDTKSSYKAKRAPNCLEWFANELKSTSNELATVFDNSVPIQMTPENEEEFLRAVKCHICEKEFVKNVDIPVKDHCHFTGKFRGAAHQDCNLQYRDYRTVPVVFHNLTHYDAHFIVDKIASNALPGTVKVIAINSEKYISFIKTMPNRFEKYKEMIKFKFIDSFRFMASSLDVLASLIPFENKKILRDEFENMSDEQIRLLERKGVFCYDYVDSWEKLEERALPPKEAFLICYFSLNEVFAVALVNVVSGMQRQTTSIWIHLMQAKILVT